MLHVRRNRAGWSLLVSLACASATGVAQAPEVKPAKVVQNAAAKELVARVEAAEAALGGIRLRLSTRGELPGGLAIETHGEIRVLRAKQPEERTRTYTELDYSFGVGMRGRMATAQTDEGILIYEEDPAFGAVFVQVPPAIVVDLEWAATVLQRNDLPGMADARAQSPLGSGVIEDLTKAFLLTVDDGEGRSAHAGEAGTWLVGSRKPGLDANDPELPLADRVELFVRERDQALLVLRHFVGDKVVQEVHVEEVEVDPAFDAAAFRVDGHGVRVRSVREHAPVWSQIEAVLEKAEVQCKAKDPVQRARPSRRREVAEELQRESANGTSGGK
ncbi:MAG: hypothetical protein AB8H80_02630 [Planctomycetota bacterium]